MERKKNYESQKNKTKKSQFKLTFKKVSSC